MNQTTTPKKFMPAKPKGNKAAMMAMGRSTFQKNGRNSLHFETQPAENKLEVTIVKDQRR